MRTSLVLLLGLGAAVAATGIARAQTVGQEIVVLVNQARWDNGQLPPLKDCSLLDTSAGGHSADMADRDFFAHCDLDTHTLPWDRMAAAGYSRNWSGENIAAGYSTAADVMTGWMGSSGHRANILSANYREIGVGYDYQSSDQGNVRYDPDGDCASNGTEGPFRSYWTQNFGSRTGVYPVVIDREAVVTDTRSVALYVYGAGWATEMRFRNESGAWSEWVPYAPEVAWTLSPGNGTKTVNAELRKGTTVLDASDAIDLDAPQVGVADPVVSVTAPALLPAVPNPFAGSTEIGFELPQAGPVRLTVYDLAGRPVSTLVDGARAAGRGSVRWDGRGSDGVERPAGIYFIRLEVPGGVRMGKVMLQD